MKPSLFPSRPGTGDAWDVAAHWVMRENHGTLRADEAAAKDAWLAEDRRHVAAYDAMSRSMNAVETHAADPRILSLRDAALGSRPEPRPRIWRVAAAALGAAVLTGAGMAMVVSDKPAPRLVAQLSRIISPATATYSTEVGERSTITLPDGSVATLNTDTVLKVAFTDAARGVRLVRGQALFEVAHGKARPFRVYAGDRTITAIGTVFDVRLEGEEVKVALVEGVVRVQPRTASPAKETAPKSPQPQVLMSAGELLEARPTQAMVVRNVDVKKETSWRSGVLVFDETPLSEAVAELNRYSTHRLVIEDTSLGAMHVTGVFKTGDLVRFARTVEEILPVHVQVDPAGTTRLSRRPANISQRG